MSTDTALTQANGEYTAENIKTLKDAAHIRQNPGMYVGNVHSAGLHHLVYEIVYNSVDEALAGFCTHIKVVLHVDGSCSVVDDGRGIPVDVKPDTGKSTLEEALTVAGTSGKFDNAAYRVSAGLHGMGAKAMNALSEWCEAEVRRGGRVYQMEFERGYATGPLKDIGPAPAGQTGTTITFKPDPEIFGALTFDYDTLAIRFREIAYLNKGLAISLTDERIGKAETFKFDGGLAEFVEYLNAGEQVEHPPIYVRKEVEAVTVEAAFQYTGREDKVERCYANNAYNPDGGTHLSGYRAGLTRAVTNYARKEGLFKDGLELKGEDFRDGLTVVVSVGHPDPLFESQTKVKLNNPEVEGIVASVVYEALTDYLERNPKEAARICKKIVLSAEARIAAKKARDALIDRKKILSGGGLPGKLMDCTTRDRDRSELFLVEGDSAGGSAESGRDRNYQAVLPLRGKVLNVERARLEKLLRNEEIAALIAAVGVDVGNAEDISRLRYGKIVILTDADVDGQHIRTLLLTFFFRQMRKLIEAGHVFVARPPLFKVTQKKESRFVQTREEMARELFTRGLKDTSLLVLPVEGQTERTLTGDALAGLIRVLDEIEAAVVILERRGHTLESFLPRADAAGQLPVFHVRLGARDHFFFSQEEVDAFRLAESSRLGQELAVADEALAPGETVGKLTAEADERYRFTVDEWHEVRALNRALARLKDAGFNRTHLVPLPAVAGREPPVRFAVRHGDARKDLDHLRQLVPEVRRLGEKGLTITRFKGLGEMDPEELWDTTLDPARRTLLQVTMQDALAAEKMFRTLMGDDVESRRDFIMKHRANVEEIDYGA
jgi:DNA gyrase subunit B